MAGPVYKRIGLKLSGEALMGRQGLGIDPQVVEDVALELKEVKELGVEIGIVIGGGNIFRGVAASAYGMDRSSADHIGMLATVINALALQDVLEKRGVQTRVQTAIRMAAVAEPYIMRRAIRHLEKGRAVILAAGTGNPYFTTDTAAALRAQEIRAEVLVKATKVDGIYDADPVTNDDAKKLDTLSYLEVLKKQLKVMDSTAISLAMDNRLPVIVFNLKVKGNLRRVICGENVGTCVKEAPEGD